MHYTFDQLSAQQAYFLMTQSIIPRPVAWVLSDSGNGSHNLAPFSYFCPVSSLPPMLMFSVGKKPDGTCKDTWVNVEARKYFVVHIASREMANPLTQSSAVLAHGESELALTGLPTCEFEGFALPRLQDCRVAFGCVLDQIVTVGETPQACIFGRLTHAYVADEMITQVEKAGKTREKIHADRIDPLARLGGDEYVTFGEILDIPRPQ